MAAHGFVENNPERLVEIVLTDIIKHHERFFTRARNGCMSPRRDVALPLNLSEKFFKCWQEGRRVVDDNFINIFRFGDPCQMPLKQICVRNTGITDESVHLLMQHHPTELDLRGSFNLTWEVWKYINEFGSNLTMLFVAQPYDYTDMGEIKMAWLDEYRHSCRPTSAGLIDCPNLRVLCYYQLQPLEGHTLDAMLHSLKRLTYLDLSMNILQLSFTCLNKLSHLTTLKLYDCPLQSIYKEWDSICTLKTLRCLDISQSEFDPLMEMPDLELLVRSLPELRSLDISGTALCGPEPDEGSTGCCIPGLEGCHLDFLGLLNCPHDASERPNIPAKQVTGSATEEQVLLSLRVYADRDTFLICAMRYLLNLQRYGMSSRTTEILEALVDALRLNLMFEELQTYAMNVFYHLIKPDPDGLKFSTRMKRRIILTVLDAMETHSNHQLLRQGGLTLCQFRIPQDMMFEYQRVVRLLIRLVDEVNAEDLLQRIGIYLLNSLACQVEGEEKQLLGDEGIIKTILRVVHNKWETNICNEVLEVAWSTLWNVTDETPKNSERFLNEDGMGLFLKCSEKFPHHSELLKNMMGLMGNVAEVHFLRHHLMRFEFISLLSDILSQSDQNIEISYNACGVLAHMVSDGPRAWTVEEHFSFGSILGDMEAAIRSWNICTKRNINYRSFEPIMRLVPMYEIPTAQLWAAWALCNLTTVYPTKYCMLVEKENGIELLEQLCNDPRPYADSKKLAQAVINTCKNAQDGIFLEVEAESPDI